MLHKVKRKSRGPVGFGDSMRIVGMQMWNNGAREAREIDESSESEDGEDVKAPRRVGV